MGHQLPPRGHLAGAPGIRSGPARGEASGGAREGRGPGSAPEPQLDSARVPRVWSWGDEPLGPCTRPAAGACCTGGAATTVHPAFTADFMLVNFLNFSLVSVLTRLQTPSAWPAGPTRPHGHALPGHARLTPARRCQRGPAPHAAPCPLPDSIVGLTSRNTGCFMGRNLIGVTVVGPSSRWPHAKAEVTAG